MSRILALIVVLLLLVGGIYFLSTLPREAPAKTITVDVRQGADAQ